MYRLKGETFAEVVKSHLFSIDSERSHMKINLPFKRQLSITKRGISVISNGRLVAFNDWKVGVTFNTSTPILEQVYFTVASEFAKLDLRHIVETKNSYTYLKDNLDHVVGERPNKYQSKFDFLFTMAYQMYKYGNAIAYIERDERGHVVSIIPQDCENYSFGNGYVTEDDVVWYKLKNNAKKEIELVRSDNIIHLRLNPNNIFKGDVASLTQTDALVKVVNKSFNSLLEQLDSNGVVKGIVKVGSAAQGFANMALANQESKQSKQDEIAERVAKAKGVLVLDSGEEWQSLATPFEAVSSEDIDRYITLILQFYGINKKIVDGSATYEEMEVFHCSRIVPIMERFIEEANYKIFDVNSVTRGHRIEYYRNPFEYVPIDKAIDIAYKGVQDTSTNERRRMIYKLAPVEGGDDMFMNKNFERLEGEHNEQNQA